MSMPYCNRKFERYIRKFGFKIEKVAFRPDLLAVKFHNQYLFPIPKRMYERPHERHFDISGIQHPDYYELEGRANAWNSKVKRTDFLNEAWDIERERYE